MESQLFTEAIINTLVLSSMYILVALGFALLVSIVNILNLAHGVIYMLGGYICYLFIGSLGLNNWLALGITIIAMAILGIFVERYAFRRFTGDFERSLVICIAITLIIQTTVNIIAGTKNMAIPTFIEGNLHLGSVTVSWERLIIFVIGIGFLLVLIWLVNWTKLGRQMRAIAQNITGAKLQGINIFRISAFACALGFAFAGIAGSLMGSYLSLSPYMGDTMLTKVLIIVMVAGFGSTGGILITGFILGALDAFLPLWVSGAGSTGIVLAVIIIILLFRPQGFFGHEA
ncbi:MAG: branched-chain amino acid ABC transporter permease [Dehalococcoidales bacterium]|nr:branched-chain amino acid ABC transporter permease [Dehalococcoidales bacterium]